MPNSLRSRLKNLVHKGILTQKDLDRIVIVPVDCNGDLISRQTLKDLGAECIAKRDENGNLIPLGNIDSLPSVSTEKTDAYKQGWHDAITTALKETYSVHTEEGHFRVVQEETLIGVGMAYEQVSMEKTGHWSRKTKVDAYDLCGVKTWGIKCQCDRCTFTTTVVEDFGYYRYCPNCGAKMVEPQESEG